MSKHALIVEDNLENAEILATMLEAQGVKATIVDDQAAILDVVNGLPQLDLVFLDLEMPNMDGYTIFNTLRQAGVTHVLPVVAFSVYTNEMAKVRKHGFHSFISKPLRPKIFPQQLQRILSNQSVWDNN